MVPPPATAAPEAPFEVTFAESGVKVRTDGLTPILDIAEAHGIAINSGCRGGGCGRCKVVHVSGVVVGTHGDAVCDDGTILTCIGCPRSHTTVSA